MSAIVSTTPILASPVQEVVESECKALNLSPSGSEKKVRVPTTLPAKYGKFIQFGYYLMNKLNAVESIEDQEDAVPVVDEKVFLTKLGIFDSLDTQQALVQEFFDSSKAINAEIRKMVHQHKRELAKADKPKKEKKVRAPKVAAADSENKEKKVKVKKGKVPTSEDQLVNELVQLATAAPATSPATSPAADKKADAMAAVNVILKQTSPIADKVKVKVVKEPKEVKEKVVKEVKEKVVNEPKEKVLKEVKEKVLKEVKEKVVKEVKEKVVNEPKEKVLKEVKEKVVKEPKEKVLKEVKEKVVKEPKQKVLKEPTEVLPKPTTPTLPQTSHTTSHTTSNPTSNPTSPQQDELQVSVFEFQSNKYLIDDNNNVYDFNTHLIIGEFLNGTLSIFTL